MPVTYTTLLTETLPDNYTRTIRGYNTTTGVVLNVLVTLTVTWPYNPTVTSIVVDKEIYIPGTTIAALTGLSFSVIDTVTLDKGQKRIIREYVFPGLPAVPRIREMIRTIDVVEAPGGPTKVTVVDDSLIYIP